ALIVTIAYIIIIAINIELSVTRARIISQRNELDAQNEKIMTYEAYLPAISELINDVRERQHNYNDKLQGIYALSVTHSDYDSLRDALQKECAAISLPSESSMLLRLDLKVLAAFLFSKSKQAAQDNKTLSISMPSPSYSSSVPEYILVEMLGILINNALEATPDGETVYLKLDCGGGTFGVEIKNPGTPFTEKQKKDIFVPGYTTKTNDRKTVLNMPEINNIPRGYGLSGLKKLTEEYDCDLIVTDEETEDGSFIVFRLITNA
ncbi:ATP-binding protein, partial [Ruminococcus sp.]|uniref:ATP-binding protein n=1 Tax=Ruminococcus sp. TaxID=41978 RepID=UPI0025891E3B